MMNILPQPKLLISDVRHSGSVPEDGTKTVTSVIASGNGTGPDKEEASISNTSATNGLVLEEVFATQSEVPNFDLLEGIAQQRVQALHRTPQVPQIICPPEMIPFIGMGDRYRVLADFENPLYIDGTYRVVATDLDPEKDEIGLVVNIV